MVEDETALNKICDIQANVWIEASAGTGKTKALTDRVLALLAGGVSIYKILCITFTKAAASEMLGRLKERLSHWKTCDDSMLLSELLEIKPAADEVTMKRCRGLFDEVLDAGNSFKLQTIHSFCQKILETFPIEAGLTTNLEILDEHEALELLKSSICTSISSAANDPLLFKAYDVLSLFKGNESIVDLIGQAIRDRAQVELLCSKTIAEVNDDYAKLLSIEASDITIDTAPLINPFSQKDSVVFAGMLKDLGCILSKGNESDKAKSEKITSVLAKISSDDLGQSKENYIEDIFGLFLTKEGEVRKSLCSAQIKNQHPECYTKILSYAEEFLLMHNNTAARNFGVINMAFAIVIRDVYRRYSQLKHNKLDYDDLIFKSLVLLRKLDNGWVMYRLDGGISHILVDEAQDTSSIQWEVLKAVSENFFPGYEETKTIFVVGDNKQSIYSFQGASSQSFTSAYEYFKKKTLDSGFKWHDVKLTLSYRSTPQVLNFVDKIFSVPQKTLGLGDSPLKHTAFRNQDIGKVELWPLISNAAEEDQSMIIPVNSGNSISPEALLARAIADNIEKIIEGKCFVPSKNRAVTAGDFLILLQQRGTLMAFIIKALQDNGLPVDGVDQFVLTDEIVIEDLISLARFVLNPYDDFNLASLLKSPLIGISEDALMRICINRKESLYKYIKENNELENIYRILNDWVQLGSTLSPYGFYEAILDHPAYGVRGNIASRLGGGAIDVISEFMEFLFRYEAGNTLALSSFVPWILKKRPKLKREFEKGQKIRVMTVHRAKGLQAPFIVLGDINSQSRNDLQPIWLNTNDTYDNILPIFFPTGIKIPSCIAPYVEELRDEQEYEKQRLLYVALTRAQDNIYITGRNTQKKSVWYCLLKDFIEATQSA